MDTGMQRLPTELIQDIIEYRLVGGAGELANLCRVSSAVRPRVEPVLYRAVFLTTRRQFDLFLHSCSITSNCFHTRSLSVDLFALEALPPGRLDALLGRLPKLEALRVSSPNIPHLRQTYNVSRLSISGAMPAEAWTRRPVARHITHLFLESPPCMDIAPRVRFLFPALTHAALVLNTCLGNSVTAIMQGLLAMRTLERLTVIYISHDSRQGPGPSPWLVSELRLAVEDERVHVYELSVLSVSSLLLEATRMRQLRMAAAALGSDTLRGMRDVWDIGTCIFPSLNSL